MSSSKSLSHSSSSYIPSSESSDSSTSDGLRRDNSSSNSSSGDSLSSDRSSSNSSTNDSLTSDSSSSDDSSSNSSSNDSLSSDSSSSYDSVTLDNSKSYQSDKKRARSGSVAKDKEVDRISELPDSIILYILSFLKAEDAVRSGVLAKRFAYLWTNLDSLDFVNSELDFINNTLFFYNRSNLLKFSVLYQDDNTSGAASKFDRWIRLLFRSSPVKDLTLKFKYCHYRLPQHFYSNSSLIKLNLLGCKISTKGFIKWESLQSLTMSNTNLPDFRIIDILSGCPSLEFLELSLCNGFTKISLINRCLKNLVIRDYRKVDVTLEIFAPYLQSFVLSGEMESVKCRVFSANSLVNCCLDFDVKFGSYNSRLDEAITMLTSLLEDFCHVKDVITIGEWGLRVLSHIERDGFPFPMFESRVKCLKLDTKLTVAVMTGIKCLLQGLNCLEKLSITKSGDIYDPPRFRGGNLCLGSEDMETDLDLKLKTVEISGFSAWESMNGKAEVLLLVRFLLKNASFLEKMTIICGDKSYHSQSLTELLEELLSFPRSSPRAVIRVL